MLAQVIMVFAIPNLLGTRKVERSKGLGVAVDLNCGREGNSMHNAWSMRTLQGHNFCGPLSTGRVDLDEPNAET